MSPVCHYMIVSCVRHFSNFSKLLLFSLWKNSSGYAILYSILPLGILAGLIWINIKHETMQGPAKKNIVLSGEAMKEMQKQAKANREERRGMVLNSYFSLFIKRSSYCSIVTSKYRYMKHSVNCIPHRKFHWNSGDFKWNWHCQLVELMLL